MIMCLFFMGGGGGAGDTANLLAGSTAKVGNSLKWAQNLKIMSLFITEGHNKDCFSRSIKDI